MIYTSSQKILQNTLIISKIWMVQPLAVHVGDEIEIDEKIEW